MNKEGPNDQMRIVTYFFVILVWVLTTGYGLAQNINTSADRYKTSALSLRLIQIVISLPLLFVYLALAFAAVTFLVYSRRISGSKEYKGYNLLTWGLFIRLAGFLVASILGIIQQKLIGRNLSNFIIFKNATDIIFNLVIFYLFYQGSRHLISTLKSNQGIGKLTKQILLLDALAGSAFVYLVFQNPYRTISTSTLIIPTYALSDVIILTTVVLPYIISWMFASLAVLNLLYYSRNVKGQIFKTLFKALATGFGMVIILNVTLQMISQFTNYWANSTLQMILLVIAIILLALVAGYWQVGKAARELDRIETL